MAPYETKGLKEIPSGEIDALIRFHARRGLLELDLLLKRFLKTRYSTLTIEDRQTFLSLLKLSDLDLWQLITGNAQADPLYASLLANLRQYDNDNNN